MPISERIIPKKGSVYVVRRPYEHDKTEVHIGDLLYVVDVVDQNDGKVVLCSQNYDNSIVERFDVETFLDVAYRISDQYYKIKVTKNYRLYKIVSARRAGKNLTPCKLQPGCNYNLVCYGIQLFRGDVIICPQYQPNIRYLVSSAHFFGSTIENSQFDNCALAIRMPDKPKITDITVGKLPHNDIKSGCSVLNIKSAKETKNEIVLDDSKLQLFRLTEDLIGFDFIIDNSKLTILDRRIKFPDGSHIVIPNPKAYRCFGYTYTPIKKRYTGESGCVLLSELRSSTVSVQQNVRAGESYTALSSFSCYNCDGGFPLVAKKGDVVHIKRVQGRTVIMRLDSSNHDMCCGVSNIINKIKAKKSEIDELLGFKSCEVGASQ
jgi:hypothetical protein